MNDNFSDITTPISDSTIINYFEDWTSLNDSIMGGTSKATCSMQSDGLELKGELVEEGGGFVSCRSPVFKPPLNLSNYHSLKIKVDGEGRTLKIALFCDLQLLGLNELFFPGIHWVAEVPTISSGTTSIEIPFSKFQPTVRAKQIPISPSINPKAITQLQLLHSKFGEPGELNLGFRPGPIKILLRSISGCS